MRWFFKVMAVAVLGLVAVELSTAQQPFPLGGMGGKGGAPNPGTLILNESVKKELKLTDEQIAKIPDAVMKALSEVLDPEQMKRFKQIDLQVKGSRAFADPNVQNTLKMTSDQKDNIKTILADADKETADLTKEMQKEAQSGNFEGLKTIRDKLSAINKETKDRCASVLSAEQKRVYQEMLGEDFKMETPRFGFDKKKN